MTTPPNYAPPLAGRPESTAHQPSGLMPRNVAQKGSENHRKTHGDILTLFGHPSIRDAQRRFAPITVRQNPNAVRYESESLSAFIGIRTEVSKAVGKQITGISIGERCFNFCFDDSRELDVTLRRGPSGKLAYRVYWEQW